jgi:hypothetical protein
MSDATAALLGDNGGGNGAAAPAAAPAAPATPPSGAPAPWYGSADEATAAYITNKGWDNPLKAIESYRNLEKFAGGSKSLVELPGPDAPPEKMAEFYARLGRPESPEKYSIEAPQGADPELVGWFKSTAHKHNLTDAQARGVFADYNEMGSGKLESMAQQSAADSEKAITDLKREWGQAYEKQIDMGKRAVAALGFNEQMLSDYEAKLGTGEMLKLFATLGTKMGEPAFEGGGRSDGSGFGTTPAQAQQQIAELKTDSQFMAEYMKGNPEYVTKMTRLMKAAHGA